MDLGFLLTIGGGALTTLGTIYNAKKSRQLQTVAINSSVKNTLENIFLTKANEQQQVQETKESEDEEDEAE